MGEFQRWNTHHSHVVPIEVCGHQLNIAQDPTSDNLGTTIWDASVILVRYMERNPQLYSRRKLEGKRVLELGAGCGLAGMYFALQGAHVTFTDLIEVVPLLQRNVTMNLGGQAAETSSTGTHGKKDKSAAAAAVPKAKVLEYCWGKPLDGLEPPYDYVVACDCVYVERLVESLVWSMAQVSGRSTTLLVASEKREEVTYAKFRARLSEDFAVRLAPRRHMDKNYDHENSEVLVCKLRKANTSTNTSRGGGGGGGADGSGVSGGGGGGGGSDSLAGNGGAVVAEGATAAATIDAKAEREGQQGTREGAVVGVGPDSVPAGASAAVLRAETGHEGPAAEDIADGLSLAGVTLAASPQGDVRRR